MTNSITAQQQTKFEALAGEIARQRKIPRQYAIEILVIQIGGGAEKLS